MVTRPLVDVMGLAPGGGAVAAEPAAPAVPGGQADALLRGVEALLPPQIDALTLRVEHDRDESGFADCPLDAFDGDRGILPFDATVPALARPARAVIAWCACGVQGVLGDQHPDGRAAGTEHTAGGGFRVGVDTDSQDRHHPVERQLLSGPRIRFDRLVTGFGRQVDHAGSAPPRGGQAVVDAVDVGGVLRVGGQRIDGHPIRATVPFERAGMIPGGLAVGDAGLIQLIPQHAGPIQQLVRIQRVGVVRVRVGQVRVAGVG